MTRPDPETEFQRALVDAMGQPVIKAAFQKMEAALLDRLEQLEDTDYETAQEVVRTWKVIRRFQGGDQLSRLREHQQEQAAGRPGVE